MLQSTLGGQTIISGSGGKMWKFSVGAAAVALVAANPQRTSITFANPNDPGVANGNILVYQTTDGAGAALAPTFATPALRAGGLLVAPGTILTLTGEVAKAWAAIADAAGPYGLTVMESNVN